MVRGRVTRVDCELRKLTVVSFPEVHISPECDHLCTPAIATEGWQWWDREAWRVDSATITLHTTPASPCQRLDINIHFQDFVNRVELISMNASTTTEQTNCFGTYKPLGGVFCRGRQVDLLLLVLSCRELISFCCADNCMVCG